MYQFELIDYIFIGIYFLFLIVIGIRAANKQGTESFLISDRKLGLISGISTINATKTGSILMIFAALLYVYGFSAIWFFIGIAAGYTFFIPFARRLHDQSDGKFYTLAEYYYKLFDKKCSYWASGINLITMFGLFLINLIATAKVFAYYTHINYSIAVVIVAIIILIYLLLGGFHAVVKTDILQYLAIIAILLLFALVLKKDIQIPQHEWNPFQASFLEISGFLILGFFIPFASPDLWQRVYAFPSKKLLSQSLVGSIILYLILGGVLAFIGLMIKTKLPELDPDIALVHGLVILLPSGLSGLIVVVLFAALMSSIDTYIYTASSTLIQDFFKHWDKEQIKKGIRKSIFGFVLLGSILAIILADLIQTAYLFSAFAMLLSVPTLITWKEPKIPTIVLRLTFLLGFLFLGSFLIYNLSLQRPLNPLIFVISFGSSLLALILAKLFHRFQKS